MDILNRTKVFSKQVTIFSAMVFAISFFTVDVSAQTREQEIKKCNAEIGPVPAFSCSQGENVPKVIANDKCNNPEALYNRCVHKSKLGRLAKRNARGVESVFSCRKSRTGTHANDNGNDYFDIAVIQYDPNTGKTCFYQYIGNHDKVIPASDTEEGIDFWENHEVKTCTMCHTNGPFIRTPHYWNVWEDNRPVVTAPDINTGPSIGTMPPAPPTTLSIGDPPERRRVLPEIRKLKKYHVIHDHLEVFRVELDNDTTCTWCHNIGAYKQSNGKLAIGHVSELAVGKIESLNDDDPRPNHGELSPTPSGHYAFMAGPDGINSSLPAAQAALKKLEDCLGSPNAHCKVTSLIPEPDKYVIRSKHGCPGHKFCNAELSWDGGRPHPMASVEHNDRVEWELLPKGNNRYLIQSSFGCPGSKWCRAELSWDTGTGSHPMASVEHNDPVEWELVYKSKNRYVIKNKHGCPNGPHCNAELSWDSRTGTHPRASVEFGDTVEWEIIKKGEQTSNCKNYRFGVNNAQMVNRVIEGKITQPTETIAEIINQENVDMVFSYFPKVGSKNPVKNITIPAGKSSGKFFVLPGYGRVEIERRPEFFSSDSRKNGANIKVCFVDR